MAQIDWNDFKKIEKARHDIQTKVRTSYSSFYINGEKYIQLDMYGQKTRKMTTKPSQVLQLDKNSAINLISFLKEEFYIE